MNFSIRVSLLTESLSTMKRSISSLDEGEAKCEENRDRDSISNTGFAFDLDISPIDKFDFVLSAELISLSGEIEDGLFNKLTRLFDEGEASFSMRKN